MANTHHTGIPKLQWVGAYPPCTPSVTIVADKNPFCLGDSVTFTPTFNCVDTATIESYEIKYGALYNWYAATDARKITSSDEWIIPTNTIRSTLLIGGTDVRGGNLKEIGTDYWDSPNTGAVNIVGFNARGSGLRDELGVFSGFKRETRIWTSNNVSIFNNGLVLFYNSANSFINTFTEEITKRQGNVIRICRPATTAELLLADGTPCQNYVGNDGKIYRTVKIGTQVWLADNLAETLYRDLTPIPEVTDNAEWAALEDGAMCYYNNDINNAYTYTNDSEIISYGWVVNGIIKSTSPAPFVTTDLANNDKVYFLFIANENTYVSNVITVVEKTEGCDEPIEPVNYGLLYNWYAATDPRNICSEGWEVPTNAQINTLISYAGGLSTGGAKLKETGLTYFDTPNTGATNEYNFNGRGCGARSGIMLTSGFYQFKLTCALMSSDLNGSSRPYVYQLQYNSLGFHSTSDFLSGGHNLRPIKITTSLTHGQTGTYTGNDGKVYRTICIGTQEWLADNLAETKFRNGDAIPEVTDNSAWAALTTGALCAYNNSWDNV